MPSWLSFWICSMKHKDKPLTKGTPPFFGYNTVIQCGPCSYFHCIVRHSVGNICIPFRKFTLKRSTTDCLVVASKTVVFCSCSKSPNSENSWVKVGNFLPPKLNFPCVFTLAAETNKFYAWLKRLILALTRRSKVDPGSTLPNQCG